MNTRIFKSAALSIVVTGLMLLSLTLSSCTAVGGLFATPTPTPTLTFTPTITPSPTSTPTNTPTPTATPLPTGRHVEVMEDGSFVFLDYDMNYGMIYPSTWYVVPFDSEDEAAATERLVAVDPAYEDLIAMARSLINFIAVKPSGDNTPDDGMVSGLALEGDMFAQLPLQDALAAQEVPQDATVVFNDVITNATGVEMGLLEYEDKENHTVVCIFKTGKGVILLHVESPTPKFESMTQELINIVGSVSLLE